MNLTSVLMAKTELQAEPRENVEEKTSQEKKTRVSKSPERRIVKP